jgi:NAD(P)-dependent dehydrogenase (short-subunit alcohol dehydrogenase family)
MPSPLSDSSLADGLFRLDGQVAVITGGSENLGFDCATAFASAGCHLILTSRTPPRAEASAKKLRERYPVDVLVLALDQRDHRSVAALAREAQAWKGRIDILVNNAGGGSGASEGNLFQRDPAAIADMISVNLTGVIYCCQEIGRCMSERKRGKIINIASIAGVIGRNRELYRRNGVKEQPVDYAAAKADVIGFTRDLAAFLAPYSIQANAISPGGFDKGKLPAAFVEGYGALTMPGHMGRIGRDIKGAALFLASPASDYVTGQNVIVDGGFTVWR